MIESENMAFKQKIIDYLGDAFVFYRKSFRKFDPSDNHLIFADPRGGSTWLMEMILSITNDLVLWEPLHLHRSFDHFRKLDFHWRQHIPEEESWPEAKQAFDQLLTGQIIDSNFIANSKLQRLLFAKSLLIKFCRGNLLLPWLVKNYVFTYKPIYFVRHPFAVVSSQIKHGAWGHTMVRFDVPDNRYNDLFTRHKSYLERLTTKEEVLTATWCIVNQYLLNHPKNNSSWLTFNYEEFVLNPQAAVERILRCWEVDYDVEKIDFERKSLTTKAGSPIKGRDQIAYWTKNLEKTQVSRMEKVLDYFEVTVYSRNVFPLVVYNYG